ncbi:hypothetical protein [Agromyces sp. NBRC 114283]|uniref:hypothetical protein n=1 Tax=Agromyces sp. NBRC 114283 TaxID=2994521 RepID=UPI0024A30E9D|nr:hypothetical protein [Agromyces sp. NBRC 114283]GLU88638.1 hypothetical protein Agsp01_08930 [Agromyces sp. NBRC 114283]
MRKLTKLAATAFLAVGLALGAPAIASADEPVETWTLQSSDIVGVYHYTSNLGSSAWAGANIGDTFVGTVSEFTSATWQKEQQDRAAQFGGD